MSERILVVDDESTVRELVQVLLELSGYEVRTAENGHEALEALKEDAFDLIITDQKMPKVTGEMLATAVKQNYPGLPVILITGQTTYSAPPVGVCVVLYKPFGFDSLRETVAATLKGKGEGHSRINLRE